MTYITDELKEQFKDFLAEQDFIYDDKETGLTEIYYWDYRDIIEPKTMEKLIKDYGDYPTVKDALHQYALENDMFDYEEARQRNTTIAFMESLGIKYTDDTDLSPSDYQAVINKLKTYQKDKPTCSNA